MIKKLFIGAVLVLILMVSILFLIPWGNYESDLEKSPLIESLDLIDSLGQAIPLLDDLEGFYSVTSDEHGVAELLFEIEGLKNTKGAFEVFTINFNILDDYKKSELNVIIESSSINTNNSMRDESLVSDEFFNAEKFPTIEYHADNLEFMDSLYMINGSLTLMEVTKELSFPFKYVGNGVNKNRIFFEAFEGSFEFDRTEYGMREEGGVGNIVTISFYCELTRPD